MTERTLSTEQVRHLYSCAYAWRTDDDGFDTNLADVRARQAEQFDAWLAQHDREMVGEVERLRSALAAAEGNRELLEPVLEAHGRETAVAVVRGITSELARRASRPPSTADLIVWLVKYVDALERGKDR